MMETLEYYSKLSSSQQELIARHLDLIIEANKRLNLTRIADRDEGFILHVEDSLSGLSEIENAPEGRYADIGSGAGYPGIPLAIASGRETLLVDARMKKMQSVEKIVAELGLTGQVSVYAGRAELLARKKPTSFAVITARALSRLNVLMELAAPLLIKGGHLICYKSHVEEDELGDAERVEDIVGMRKISDRSFELSGAYQRRILVFEKFKSSRIKLPRQEGMAQKKPL